MPRLRPKTRPSPALIGWRERVRLPELGIGPIMAKVDTGARSASLHATDIRFHGHRVDFNVPIDGRNHHCSLPYRGHRRVKSSSGHAQMRAVVKTMVRIGDHDLEIEVTLTDRADMGFPMLLGRTSIRGQFVVHPGKSFLLKLKKNKPK